MVNSALLSRRLSHTYTRPGAYLCMSGVTAFNLSYYLYGNRPYAEVSHVLRKVEIEAEYLPQA